MSALEMFASLSRQSTPGFWLSDSKTVGKPLMSEHAAIEEAREMARAFGGATTIYTWHHGEPIELYRTHGIATGSDDVQRLGARKQSRGRA